MSKTTLIEQHQVALDGLKLNTAKLMTFAKSKWTWINPKQNRVTIDKLIRELVGYYKALDRNQLSTCSHEIDAARSAIFAALIASAENAEERGALSVQEMHSRLGNFDKVILTLEYDQVPVYVISDSQTISHSEPLPLYETKSQGPSLWESCKNFFSGIWNAIKSFCSVFFSGKPDQTEVIITPKSVSPLLPPPSASTTSTVFQPQRDVEEDRLEYERLRTATQAGEWPVLHTQKKIREPGLPVSRKFIRKQ